MRKVPQVTAYFWVIKVLTTALGESTSDFAVHQIDPVFAVAFGAIGLAIGMVLQFSVRRYVPWIYWFAVTMVAVFGTMAADVLHIKFGVPYSLSTLLFAVLLACVFSIWYKSEKTLSIHSIYTFRREAFYWATVMSTFALGTAAGDMTAITLHLGYFSSGVLFAIVIAIPALAYWRLGMNHVLAFWSSYIVTRPLGASIADWLGKSHKLRGLGIGDGPVSACLVALIVGFVAYLTVTRKDVDSDHIELQPG